MKKRNISFILLLTIMILSGCKEQSFPPIPEEKAFVASINIQQPSIDFLDGEGHHLASWEVKKGYTGGLLVGKDKLLLYGNQLEEADVYQLSTGKRAFSIPLHVGTTNVIYDEQHKKIYVANGKENTISSFNESGKKLKEAQVGNYPMSMAYEAGKLYVINYKDTSLSVLSEDDLSLQDEWEIEKSSHGIAVLEDVHELWIGGHGSGSKPNASVKVYDLTSGEQKKEIVLPLMPVGFSKTADRVYVVSHGKNALYELDHKGNVLKSETVGANPFIAEKFQDYVVVAGYDDQTLYFLKQNEEPKTVQVGKGPFQLIVREED